MHICGCDRGSERVGRGLLYPVESVLMQQWNDYMKFNSKIIRAAMFCIFIRENEKYKTE